MSFALFTLSGTSYLAVFPAELLIKLMLKLLLKFLFSVLSVLVSLSLQFNNGTHQRLLEVYFVLVRHVVSTVPAYAIVRCSFFFYKWTLTKEF